MSAPDGGARNGGIELSIVVPTFRESGNVAELVRRLQLALAGLNWELTFVDDDSSDGTSAVVRELARQDPRIRCLQRIGRRGLSSACVEGLMASSADVLAVMDADLQHDETQLPRMLETLRSAKADVVVASRYMQGGAADWGGRRERMSLLATRLSRLICRQDVSDPMSGFFLLRRAVLDDTVRRLSAVGFKILLDIIASSQRPLLIREVPYRFRDRLVGESKLDSLVMWEFAMLLADKMTGGRIPVRFIAFAAVGAIGVAVHLSVLVTLLQLLHLSFALSQASATVVSMVFNFATNNVLTYRDRRLTGWRWMRGLATFVLACGIGALANVGVASWLFRTRSTWLVAGLAGISVSVVWNYAITRAFTWGAPSERD